MSGTTSDVGGMDSAMTNWNMVIARTAVSANDTFSPDSGGNTNTSIPVGGGTMAAVLAHY